MRGIRRNVNQSAGRGDNAFAVDRHVPPLPARAAVRIFPRPAVTVRPRPLLAAVRDAGHPVAWVCDPMHGNTFTSDSGRKTRAFDDIVAEIGGFVRAHRAEGTWPGGIHIELTGDDVTECLGGAEELRDNQLDDRYQTVCDPRLNGRQSVDLAFRVAELLRDFT